MSSAAYRADHYAAGWRAKVQRALAAGPRYYLWALPRYLWRRHQVGLGPWDLRSLVTPLREFAPRAHHRLPLPPMLDEALGRLAATELRLTMPPLRFQALAAVWWRVRDAPGALIECGAYEGATALALAVLDRIAGHGRTVHVLDTFDGIPAAGADDPFRHRGEFAVPPSQVEILRRAADQLGVADRLRIHPGLFHRSFPTLEAAATTYALAHVDANVFEGTLEACDHVLPRLAPGGAAVFDDYAGPFDLGARLAIDLAFRRHAAASHLPPQPRPLAWSSAWVRSGAPGAT